MLKDRKDARGKNIISPSYALKEIVDDIVLYLDKSLFEVLDCTSGPLYI